MSEITATIVGTRDFLRAFFRTYPQYEEFRPEYPKVLTNVIKEFHADFIEAVIDNRFGADMPLMCGNFKIVSYKSKRKFFNYFAFKNTGKYEVFNNNHTNGLSCKVLFTNNGHRYKLKDKMIWAFYPSIKFSRTVSKAFSENYHKYIFSPNRGDGRKKQDIFTRKKLSDDAIEEFLKTYNEFEIE